MTTFAHQAISSEGQFNKRPRPLLKLNTKQGHYEDKKIYIRKNSADEYVVENHPHVTDISKSASESSRKDGHFFKKGTGIEWRDDLLYTGKYYYVIQKSNGKEMQDRCKAAPVTLEKDIAYFGVFDGHSTQIVPEIVAQKLDLYFLDSFKYNASIVLALQTAFKRMEEEIISYVLENNIRGGTTALCTVFYRKEIYVANVGDCRAVIFQQKSFKCLSNLHDFYNEDERNSVEHKGGFILKNRLSGELALSRSLGDAKFKDFMSSQPDIITHQIQEDDEYLLIGSDGFWNGLDPQMAFEKIEKFCQGTNPNNFSLKNLGDYLEEESAKNIKTKKDNSSLIVISIRDYLLSQEDRMIDEEK